MASLSPSTAPVARLCWAWVCGFGLLWAVGGFTALPAENAERHTAEQLASDGRTTQARDVERYIARGRALYVGAVRATFTGPDGDMRAELLYAEDADIDWSRTAPYDVWEPATRDSRYAPPLTVRYLPADPSVAMADRDVTASLRAGLSTPWQSAAFLVPTAVTLAVPRLRRWLVAPLRANPPALAGTGGS